MLRIRLGVAVALAFLVALAAVPAGAQDQPPPDPPENPALDIVGEPVEGADATTAGPTTLRSPAAAIESLDEIVVADGATQPVFGYTDAIRERVWVEADFDSDLDGVNDLIAMDIMRPAATEDGLEAPVIMVPSPYYTTLCRGNEGECIEDVDGDGLNDKWPLFYDNFFVPRGYAVVLLHMAGTGFSTGCPVNGGTGDNRSAVMAVDWLNGRRTAHDAEGGEVVADWHNGESAMIGKSYDGTLANAAAATGVEGLTTIVPIAAISSWYNYSRSNGIRFNTNYPAFLSNAVTNPDRRDHCEPIRDFMSENDGDETGDFTEFWVERDYLKDVDNVSASVFVVHGLQDNNVKTDHFSEWWYALAERDVPRKLWLTRSGHEEPFDFRRAEWVDTIHAWFDYWLQGVDNGIMDEPMVDIEYGPDEWVTHSDWPLPRSKGTRIFFQAGEGTEVGTLDLTKNPTPEFRSFEDDRNQFEGQMVDDPEEFDENRLVFLSDPLTAPLHVSGTPELGLVAAVDDVEANLGVVLMDYGPEKVHVSTSSEGVSNVDGDPEDCWGESSEHDDSCYIITEKNITTATQWRVSKGILDGQNKDDYTTETPLVPGEYNRFEFEMLSNDYVFEAGHRIGVVVVSSYRSYPSIRDFNEPTITVDVSQSRLVLPVVGGLRGARDAGLPAEYRHSGG